MARPDVSTEARPDVSTERLAVHKWPGNSDVLVVQTVNVVEISQEWAGGGELNLETTQSDVSGMQVPRCSGRRPWAHVPPRSPNGDAASAGLPKAAAPQSITNEPLYEPAAMVGLCNQAPFVLFMSVYVADFIMRTWTLAVCAQHGAYNYVWFLAPLQILGIILSGYITFHDADVQLWLHQISEERWLVRTGVMSLMCGVFSCCQMIQVKRAWARQLHTAEIMTEMDLSKEDLEDARCSTAETVHYYGGRERVLPVALFTGVPYLIVLSCILQMELWAVWYDRADWVLSPLIISLITAVATVSLGIAEIDVAVSGYVLKRYHYSSQLKGFCAGHVQWFYGICHFFFRSCEVTMRVFVVSTLFMVTYNIWGESLMIIALVGDYVMGVSLLRRYARVEEPLSVHLIVGVALLMADLTHFVDQPTFAEPARFISTWLSVWRFLCLVSVLVVSFYVGHSDAPTTRFGWEFRNYTMLVSASLYFVLRFSPIIRTVGRDLHTAARSGDVERTKTLLRPNSDGQVLDVNARTKDTQEMTPAMLASQGGYNDILDCLSGSGAELDASTSSGSTCLHFAAARLHVETCRHLIRLGADTEICNVAGLRPQDVARSSSSWWWFPRARRDIAQVFAEHSGREKSPPRKRKIYAVSAEPCELPLCELFPEIAGTDDQMPSVHTLHSVSGLIASRSAGVLTRRLLAPVNPPSALPLGALRRVRDLGVGGFGRVIEVELPYRAWDNLMGRGSRPKHFAMKIQPTHKARQTAASEVLALQRVRHPFIVRLERAFATRKFFALVLELCPTDLNRVLCETQVGGQRLGLPRERAALYMGQILLALVHLHEVEGIVYRDVKPENILISDRDQAKLTDFGLAQQAGATIHRSKSGTLGFLAPELVETSEPVLSCPSGRSTRSSETERLRDTFKIDTYAFGMTLELTLLGENAGQTKDVRKKGLMMRPLFVSDQENIELLCNLRDANKLCSDGYALLVDHLLSSSPASRACLSDFEVQFHPFFLNSLGCNDLKSHLLADCSPSLGPGIPNVASWSSFFGELTRSRSTSNLSSGEENRLLESPGMSRGDESKRLPLLAEQGPETTV